MKYNKSYQLPDTSYRLKIIIVLVLILTLRLTLLTLNGFCGAGVTGATFLKLGLGSRPAAMGEAFAGVADDVTAIYWNPAGLGKVGEKQVSFIHSEWFQGIHHSNIGYCQPAFGGTLGAAGTILWIDGIERRAGDTANPDGYIVSRDIAASVAYARPMSENLNLGATLKILFQQLDDRSATGVALDLGLLYNMKDDVATGISIQNIGYESAFISEQSPLPLNLKLGISKMYPDSRLTIASDINYGIMDNVFIAGAGMELWLHPMFCVRGGYKYNTASTVSLGFLSGITCGAGFNVNNIEIDYAFVPYGDLGFTHRVSMIARL